MSKHRNENISEEVGFCKPCLKEIDGKNVELSKDMMRLMNVPFVSSVWENAIEQGGDNPFPKYLQLVATKRNYKDFADSDNDRDIEGTGVDLENQDKLVVRWGIQEDPNTYIELEASYKNLTSIKPPSTVLDEKRYAQIVMIERKLNNALFTGGDTKDVTAFKKLYEDNLRAMGLDVDASSKDEELVLGKRIAEWEKEAPIPIDSNLDDVDGIKEYVNKWFVIPMKRVFGRATEEEIQSLYDI